LCLCGEKKLFGAGSRLKGKGKRVQKGNVLFPYPNFPGIVTPLLFSRRGDGGEVFEVKKVTVIPFFVLASIPPPSTFNL
jgi:hypothetical protein